MQGLLNNVTGGMAWAEGYSLALSLLFILPAIIAFLRGHRSRRRTPWHWLWPAHRPPPGGTARRPITGWRTEGGKSPHHPDPAGRAFAVTENFCASGPAPL